MRTYKAGISFCRLALLLLAGTGSLFVARADGLPGEYLISGEWRTMFSYNSPLYNPAFMADQQFTSARAAFSVSPDDAAQLWEIGAIQPLGLYQTAGLTWVAENGRPVRDNPFDNGVFTRGNESSNHNSMVMLSYAINPWGKLSIGANLNGYYQSNFGTPTKAFGADLGISYRLLYNPLLGYHLIGLTYQNVIPPKLAVFEKMPYSSQAKAVYHGELLDKKINLDMQVNITDFLAGKDFFTSGVKKYEWDLACQGMFWPLPFLGVGGYADFGNSRIIESWGLAAGVNVPYMNAGRDFMVLYQYRDEVHSPLLGSHSIYFRADMGHHREELQSRNVARVASLSANDLYNKALKLYFKEKYWDAYFIFQRILVEFPDFFKNDFVGYYAGSCLEEMDMRDEAVRTYQDAKARYPMSTIIPAIDLGLMRVQYRFENYGGVSNQFIELNRPEVPDSMKAYADYFMGEMEFLHGNYRKAEDLFEVIPEEHPAYIFAQHSIAIAKVLMGSGSHLVISNLENCISSKAETPEQKVMVDRSYLMLGLLFYEDGALSKAVVALRSVPKGSYYYEDAQLGLGWCAIKARQWTDCISAGQEVAGSGSSDAVKCEGVLIQAYGKMMQKQYQEAIDMIKPVVEKIKEYRDIPQDSFEMQRMRNESNRLAYTLFSERVTSIARLGGVAEKQYNIDSLHQSQTSQYQVLLNFMKFSDSYKRNLFFGRNANNLREDIEYAYATLQKILNASGAVKEQQKIMDKDKAIESEIDKLKQEMEKLDKKK